ncbi:helix-turn-helix domain-containing protein [Parapedobacter deserti]|uniref:Helix-turn-helix domain-containing protein n=1 Tax=Parapedobacter deserti TaxID=1912957 RepID=A0ABV7JJ02_9SPHI
MNRKANVYFGVFALIWATFWLDEMILPASTGSNDLVVLGIRFVQFIAPITFYLSVVFYTDPHHKYAARDLAYLAPSCVFLIFSMLRSVFEENIFNLLYLILVFGHALFYTILAYFKIRQHKKNIERFASTKEPISLNWIKYIIYAFIGSSVVVLLYNVAAPLASLNIYINTYFLMVVYFVAYNSVKQKQIYPIGLDHAVVTAVSGQDDTKRGKLLDDGQLRVTKERLLLLMEAEMPYLDSELNLPKLAGRLGVSSHQLSYVINTGLGENFYQFVNRYRVRKAQELLSNTEYDHLNMLAIGYESGFNSKTSFNTTFKKLTSFTPTDYRKKRQV